MSVVLTATDGTAPFNGAAAQTDGFDHDNTNGIVRTNDIINYRVEVSANGVDETTSPTSFTVVLPKGQYVQALPPTCLSGSSLTPATMPNPTVPLTSASYTNLPQQTVVCNIGTPTLNSTTTYPLDVVVRPEVPNNTVMGPVSASAVGTSGTRAVSNELSLTASAGMQWDLSKNGVASTQNTGSLTGPLATTCPQDATQSCVYWVFPVMLSAPAGGKGSAPATSPITFTDDVSPAALFPGLTAAQQAAISADPAKYGITVSCASQSVSGQAELPFSAISNTPVSSSVRRSGTISCDQPGGPSTPVNVSIANTDTSLVTYPSTGQSSGLALPANQAYAISLQLRVVVPRAVINDFGTLINGNRTLAYRNTYTNLLITGLDGDQLTSADQPTSNDYRSGNFAVNAVGVGASKVFAGNPGNSTNYGGYSGGNVLSGPPGAWTWRSGGIQVFDDQTVTSAVVVTGSTVVSPSNQSAIACDVWDNTKIQLKSGNYPGDGRVYQALPSGGEAVWISGYSQGNWSTPASPVVPVYTVQYSSGAAVGNGTASRCDTGDWYDDPNDAALGNDPTLAASGIYSAVNRVRVWMELPPATSGTAGTTAVVSIGLRVVPGQAPGTIIPNWASVLPSNSATLTQDEMLANTALSWTQSGYNPGTSTSDPAGNTGGNLGDRLIVAPAFARITKLVKGPGQTSFGSTPPSVTGGDTVQYQLSPSYTTGGTPGNARSVWVEDCLPAGQNFTSATLTPTVISVGSTPADAKIAACATGATYIRWDLGLRTAGAPITPIVVTVTASRVISSGSFVNSAVISADGDLSSLALRSATANISVVNPSGIRLEKQALTPQVQVNRTGQATNELNRWKVTLLNNNATGTLSNPDLIDVLPVNGSGGTDYAGTFSFVSAAVVAGSSATKTVDLWYTSAATVNQDPSDVTNGASGTTTWCDAPSGGNVISGAGTCPTSAASVTGVRITRIGSFNSGDSIEVELAMVGIGNEAGDSYVNSVFARIVGQALSVGPALAPETVVSSSIGDRVWSDVNSNGLQDAAEASQNIAGFPVSVAGTDDLGNPVSLSTTTNSSGIYGFSGLRAGSYVVTFSPSGLTTGQTFTIQNVGTDTAVDSNGDQSTGVTASIALAANTNDPTIDQGVVPAFSNLDLSKSVVDPTPVAPGRATEFPVVVDCTAPGQSAAVRFEETLLSDGTVVTIPNLEAGTVCVIQETDANGAEVTYSPSNTVTVAAGATAALSVINTYEAAVTSITVNKVVVDPTPTAAGRATTFPVQVVCDAPGDDSTGDIDTELILSGDGTPQTVDGVYLGSDCTVTETDSNGATVTYEVNSADVDSVSFTAPETNTGVTITNTYDAALTSVALNKVVVDPTPAAPGRATEFPVNVSCLAPGASTPTVTGVSLPLTGETVTVDGILVGSTCSVSETDANGAAVSYSPESTWTATDGVVVEIEVTNTYEADLTSLTVQKQVVDPTPGAAGRNTTFPVTVECTPPGGGTEGEISEDLVLNGDGTAQTVSGIYVGSSCTVTETDSNGATATYSLDGVGIDASSPIDVGTDGATVVVTNTYEAALTSFSLVKNVVDPTPAADGRDTEFPVTVVCTWPTGTNSAAQPDITRDVVVTSDGDATIVTEIPVGARCAVEETDSKGAVATYSDPSGIVVVTSGSETTITNTYAAVLGAISLKKVVVDSTPNAPGRATTFPVTVVCSLEGQDDVTYDVVLSKDGTPIVISGVMIGSECQFTETDLKGAESVSYSSDGHITVVEGSSAQGVVTNTYKPAILAGLASTGATFGFALPAASIALLLMLMGFATLVFLRRRRI